MKGYQIAITILGGLVVAWLSLGLLFDWGSQRLLPDSVLAQAVLDSPEGRAFTAKYPDPQIDAYSDSHISLENCCMVTLRFSTNSGSISLYTEPDVSSDLKNITVSKMTLNCYDEHKNWWRVDGDIVENLKLERQDCWDIGPPPTPSGEELIQIAKNTTVGKAYLAKYPDNDISVQMDPSRTSLKQPQVIFTPTRLEPIRFGISFTGLNWDIGKMWIVCSNGDYHYSDEYNFWSYLEPNNECLHSVHDKLVIANETAQAKAFTTKYPNVGLHSGDSIAQSTVKGYDSIIEYKYRGHWEVGAEGRALKEAHLLVMFEADSNIIADFEARCTAYNGTSPNFFYHNSSGMDLDVARFLQHNYCPTS